MQQRKQKGCLSAEQKLLILEHLQHSGSLKHTRKALKELERCIGEHVLRLESVVGSENWVLRLLIQKLSI
jgi:hypothetical protein